MHSFFKRLKCRVFGHVPWEILERPKDTDGDATLFIGDAGYGIPTLTINTRSHVSNFHVCMRCNQAYFETKRTVENLFDADTLDIFREFKDWRDEQVQEMEIRESHPNLQRAWDNYLIQRKLILGNEQNVQSSSDSSK